MSTYRTNNLLHTSSNKMSSRLIELSDRGCREGGGGGGGTHGLSAGSRSGSLLFEPTCTCNQFSLCCALEQTIQYLFFPFDYAVIVQKRY